MRTHDTDDPQLVAFAHPMKRGLAERLRGPWRVVVRDPSMRPAIEPGDWLLIDPTTARWPRRGTVAVFREPVSEVLAIKRVAAGPGERVAYADGFLHLGPDEAWLLSDAPDAELLAAGFGEPIDSRRYGPVPLASLVGRAWFRYAPLNRLGPIPRRRSPVSSGQPNRPAGSTGGDHASTGGLP